MTDRAGFPGPKLLFLHLPKAGGMSLNGILVRNYRGWKQYNVGIIDTNESMWREGLQRIRDTPREEIEKVAVFKGHFIYGLHEVIPGSVEYITFLRDPVKRLVSHYKMIRRMNGLPAGHVLDPAKADWNLEMVPDFLRTLDNYQVRAISGLDYQLPYGAVGPEHLEIAKRNLDTFKFVGLTEQFDLSLTLLRRVFGWKMRFFVPDNVAPDGGASPSPEAAAKLRELNRYDLELYQYARQRLERLAAAQSGSGVETKFFQLGNASHIALHRGRHWVKRGLGLEKRPVMGG
jgi:hypothetical protein